MRLSQVGELGLLAELERRGLAQRIENDAAQLEDGLVVTQDALVEGVHFRFDFISWRDLGYRAAAVNLSDLAASGGAIMRFEDGLVVEHWGVMDMLAMLQQLGAVPDGLPA